MLWSNELRNPSKFSKQVPFLVQRDGHGRNAWDKSWYLLSSLLALPRDTFSCPPPRAPDTEQILWANMINSNRGEQIWLSIPSYYAWELNRWLSRRYKWGLLASTTARWEGFQFAHIIWRVGVFGADQWLFCYSYSTSVRIVCYQYLVIFATKFHTMNLFLIFPSASPLAFNEACPRRDPHRTSVRCIYNDTAVHNPYVMTLG